MGDGVMASGATPFSLGGGQSAVMLGLVPSTHGFGAPIDVEGAKGVGARDKPEHDGGKGHA
jgi:hypothetical protein